MLGTSYVEDLMTKKNSARSKANELQSLVIWLQIGFCCSFHETFVQHCTMGPNIFQSCIWNSAQERFQKISRNQTSEIL